MKKYYHITSNQGEKLILKNGLKCDDEGNIFLLDSLQPSDSVAVYQLGMDKYSIIEVSSEGFEKPLIRDEVAEFTAHHQFICQQPLIKPNYLKLMDRFTINPFALATRDNIVQYNVIEEGFANLDYHGKILFLKERFQSNRKYVTYLEEILRN